MSCSSFAWKKEVYAHSTLLGGRFCGQRSWKPGHQKCIFDVKGDYFEGEILIGGFESFRGVSERFKGFEINFCIFNLN